MPTGLILWMAVSGFTWLSADPLIASSASVPISPAGNFVTCSVPASPGCISKELPQLVVLLNILNYNLVCHGSSVFRVHWYLLIFTIRKDSIIRRNHIPLNPNTLSNKPLSSHIPPVTPPSPSVFFSRSFRRRLVRFLVK